MQTIYDAKILIVDDNQDLLNLVTTALRSTGYNQLTACTGCAAAQAAFAANRPDLMILDINLPDGDGFSLFRTLHSMADIPALFLSARDADADRLFGLGLGADDYLTKPFLTQELLLRIQRILQRCYRGELWRTAAKTLQLGQRTVYLADYPVQCWAADYGLFVVAEPVGTCWKYNIDMKQKMIIMLAKSIQPTMVELLLVVLGCCLFFSWRGSKSLQTVTAGLDTLAQGGTVSLPAAGFAGELAQKLNETSEQLRRRNEIIARRDTARTEWIAGVSHDIRTPLALILGWAEQLQRDATLPAAARQKAGGICTQCEKIRSLIEDLNLTSKLQYGAQPLRRRSTQAGPFLRRVVAAFCENPLAARCTLDCSITPAVEAAILHADAALLTRALENVLQNAVRHNAGPITLAFHADADETTLHLTIQDDGTGYPQSVLAVLNGEPEGENAPHILGLHVVEQIINAHGGSVQFVNRDPHGAKVMMQLPLAKDENEK